MEISTGIVFPALSRTRLTVLVVRSSRLRSCEDGALFAPYIYLSPLPAATTVAAENPAWLKLFPDPVPSEYSKILSPQSVLQTSASLTLSYEYRRSNARPSAERFSSAEI